MPSPNTDFLLFPDHYRAAPLGFLFKLPSDKKSKILTISHHISAVVHRSLYLGTRRTHIEKNTLTLRNRAFR